MLEVAGSTTLEKVSSLRTMKPKPLGAHRTAARFTHPGSQKAYFEELVVLLEEAGNGPASAPQANALAWIMHMFSIF